MIIMYWKRLAVLAFLLCILTTWAPTVRAQDDTDDSEEKKSGFWGNEFALFLEAYTGSTAPEDFDASVSTGTTYRSWNTLSFDDFTYARAGAGWKLPHDRGHFSIRFNGYKESGYSMTAFGDAMEVIGIDRFGRQGGVTADPTEMLNWWEMMIQNGELSSTGQFPKWRPGFDVDNDGCADYTEIWPSDDVDCDSIPDPEEVFFDEEPNLSATRNVTDDLQNRFQTIDVLYGRDFGGRRFGGRWSAGLRHYKYEGNVPVPAWLMIGGAGFGYTDGVFLPPLIFNQNTSGTGPTGSLGFLFRMFREKLELYTEGRVAFLIQGMDADSGDFHTIVRVSDTQYTYTLPSRLVHSLDKDVWNVGLEVGATFRLEGGLSIQAGYHFDSFHDSVMLPNTLSIPSSIEQLDQDTSAIYRTQDIRSDGWHAGLRFQF